MDAHAVIDAEPRVLARHLVRRSTGSALMVEYDEARLSRPYWIVVQVLVVAINGYALVGVCLAMTGHFNAFVPLVVSVPLAIASIGPLRQLAPRADGRDRWFIAAVAIAVLSFCWNAANAGEHVVLDADPASYLTTARWLDRTGELRAYTSNELLLADSSIRYDGPAVFEVAPGVTEFQFNHAPAVVYALGYRSAGDRGLFHLPAAIASVGLLAVYAAVRGFFKQGGLAVAATATLAVSLPFIYVARDTFSETFVLMTVWAGLALAFQMHGRRDVSRTALLLLGFAFGSASIYRIDAWMYLSALFVITTLLLLNVEETRRWRIPVLVCAAAAPPVLVGFADALVFSGPYVEFHSSELKSLAAATIAVAIACAVVAISVAKLPRVRQLIDGGTSRAVGLWAAGLVGAIGLFAWQVRPHVETATGTWPAESGIGQGISQMQQQLGQEPNAIRSYAELSVRSLGWYLGRPTVALAIAGAAGAVFMLLRRPRSTFSLFVVAMALCVPLYLARPSINPIQLWITRRYSPFIVPAFAVLAGLCADWIASRAGKRWPRRGTVGAVAAAMAGLMFVPAAIATWPVRSLSITLGWTSAVEQTCEQIGNATTIEIDEGQLAMPLRAWCGATVGRVPADLAPGALAAVRAANADLCLPVFVIRRGLLPESVTPLTDHIGTATAIGRRTPRGTLITPVETLVDYTLQIDIALLRLPEECDPPDE